MRSVIGTPPLLVNACPPPLFVWCVLLKGKRRNAGGLESWHAMAYAIGRMVAWCGRVIHILKKCSVILWQGPQRSDLQGML